MPKPLVIVESPAKARTIAGFLGSDYEVMASIGHIRDLPKSGLAIDVDNGFRPEYEVPAGKKDVVRKLKAALKNADELILATDEDREGEAISWHIVEVLQPKVPTKRMVFHEITPSAIQEAIDNPRTLDLKLVEAQEGRRVLDRLVGYEVSPVLWRKIGSQARSAGRVQSVAVRMVVERERARMAFRRGGWFDLEATFEALDVAFGASLTELNGVRVASGNDFDPSTGQVAAGREVVLLDEGQAAALVAALRERPFRVRSVESQQFVERPKPPFTTSTLQQEASRKLRFPAAKTMAVAQRLYERGFITYMRTDSTNLSEQAITAARTAIRERFGAEFLPDSPRLYRGKVKNAQEAHEAIRPAGERIRPPEAVAAELDADERRLYELVWNRTVACQMVDARARRVTVRIGAETDAGDNAVFRASGKSYEFLGFRRVYVEDTDDDGTFDKSTIFADKLSWPTGIALYDGGAYVTATPYIWYFKDNDGDRKADVRKQVYTGFRKFNVQAVINNLKWGLDGYLYAAGSSNGGQVRLGAEPASAPVIMATADFRFRPTDERFE